MNDNASESLKQDAYLRMFILDDFFKPTGLDLQKVFNVAINADPTEEG